MSLNDYFLPLMSNEQFQIIKYLEEDNNVIVNAVAGSGKTTTNLHIATHFPNLRILLITYNAKLKLETRYKIKILGLKNIECHSYHSFCVKYYDSECFTDSEIIEYLSNSPELSIDRTFPKYDIIILDETQDMSPLYFQLFCLIFRDNLNPLTKICILGDERQSIFDFNKADQRFITMADKIFKFNTFSWQKCNLSQSFRVTFEMSDFINNCMLGEERIISKKITGNKPRYIICNTFGERSIKINHVFDEVKYYLDMGYLPNDIFILSPSIKTNTAPTAILENKIKQELDIPIFVPIGDDTILDGDIIANKLVFSTFHQAKGLERKVVLVFCFDNAYFKYYKKNKNPYECPNELYVAATRSSEHLSLFHHCQNEYLNFLDISKLKLYCDVVLHTNLIFIIKKNGEKVKPFGVCDLLKHIEQQGIDSCCKFLNFEIIRKKGVHIDIPVKTLQNEDKDLYEEVSELTGIAIPSFLDYQLHGEIDIFNFLKSDSKNTNVVKIFNNINVNKEDKFENICDFTPSNLLKIANCWNAYTSQYIFKIYQITNYDWVTDENFTKCVDRLKSLNFTKEAKFEVKVSLTHKLCPNKEIVGFIDTIFNNNVYEFKCVSKLKKEHCLQLALYKYLYEKSIQSNDEDEEPKIYYLYNILSDELLMLTTPLEELEKLVALLFHYKYSNNIVIEDDLFLLICKNISLSYF